MEATEDAAVFKYDPSHGWREKKSTISQGTSEKGEVIREKGKVRFFTKIRFAQNDDV